ncbi:PAS domain S-box-containing protein [Actinocorallia herbida]|uniref:histidine kinase n=1 Tax=Actinocorallia herbida TaxID=58109 RepID=A0A3N1D1M2_9ACTN|nr:PAS domain-containing sensor histidine kinase [Actinocorallia herbida]ROO87421.1 PAS domain S-box-containing protein [Actinocorallia herbida]
MDEMDFFDVFDAAPVALAVLSTDLRFVAVNRAHEELFGRSREQCVGRPAFEVFPSRTWQHGKQALKESMERAVAGGECGAEITLMQRYDIETAGAGGTFEERYWTSANCPVRNRDGEICGLVVRLQEVTSFVDSMHGRGRSEFSRAGLSHAAAVEAQLFAQTGQLQELNQRLRNAEAHHRHLAEGLQEMVRHQRQAVADTSHDLRSPLTGLRTRLEDALADPDCDPHEILQAALHDAERLGDIISDLLELGRLESGAPAATEPIDLARLLRTEIAHRDPATTTTTYLTPGIVVDTSEIRLTRLVDNLLANAERHTRSHIDVRLTTDDGHAVLEVIDNGPGIPAADREKVFDRFFRRPDARAADPGGSGLGLPISRQIAEAHGGTLLATDRADGVPGARLVLRLPLHHRP